MVLPTPSLRRFMLYISPWPLHHVFHRAPHACLHCINRATSEHIRTKLVCNISAQCIVVAKFNQGNKILLKKHQDKWRRLSILKVTWQVWIRGKSLCPLIDVNDSRMALPAKLLYMLSNPWNPTLSGWHMLAFKVTNGIDMNSEPGTAQTKTS